MDATGYLHDEQHANANDAIEALQAKVGVDGSSVSSSHDYKIAQLESQVVPEGGTTGQVLSKASGADFDTEWTDPTGGGTSDHGALSGLADDDHTQYHNDTRGDARYYTKAQVDTSLAGKSDTSHTHTASDITDFDTEVSNNTDVSDNTAARHTHANKALLDTYTQTEANLADAVTKKHAHSNQAVLDATTASFLTTDESKLDGIEAGADVTDAGNVGSSINGATAKTTPVDHDAMPLIDSDASNVLKKVTWSNIKATLKTYLDTLYVALSDFAFANLSDVDVSGVASGDIMVYDSGTGKFVVDSESKGGVGCLSDRLNTISNFASPNAGGYVSGYYYDQSFAGSAAGTRAGAVNRIYLSPFYTNVSLTLDLIGVSVSTAVASSNAQVLIYDADADGWPDNLVFQSGNLDCSAVAYVSEATSFMFESGKTYWVGVHWSSTQTLRGVAVASLRNLGIGSSATVTSYTTALTRTATFGTPPDPWTFVSTDLVANIVAPSVRFRIVA